jgi:hypothetical protein
MIPADQSIRPTALSRRGSSACSRSKTPALVQLVKHVGGRPRAAELGRDLLPGRARRQREGDRAERRPVSDPDRPVRATLTPGSNGSTTAHSSSRATIQRPITTSPSGYVNRSSRPTTRLLHEFSDDLLGRSGDPAARVRGSGCRNRWLYRLARRAAHVGLSEVRCRQLVAGPAFRRPPARAVAAANSRRPTMTPVTSVLSIGGFAWTRLAEDRLR